MNIDPNELPSVHVFLNVVRIFFETEQSDPRWKEIYQDAKQANEYATAILSKPAPGGEPCPGLVKRIYGEKFPFIKAV